MQDNVKIPKKIFDKIGGDWIGIYLGVDISCDPWYNNIGFSRRPTK